MLPADFTLGTYRIERLLGRGAMGAVYRAWSSAADKPVAIKTIHSDLLVSAEREMLQARFRQEAAIGMRLRHPLIVQVYECSTQDGIIYLAMELVEGQELSNLLTAQPALSLPLRLAIALQVLNALDYAHRQGVIHRDIKPANVMVHDDYSIALTDFGIAHVQDSQMTQSGELLGSPLYMAPEQLRGAGIDQRTDLFSAGVLLYLLLTKHKPFAADSLAALMRKILHEPAPLPSSLNPQLPPAFDAVLQRALAKDPAARFSSALEFANAVRAARAAALPADASAVAAVATLAAAPAASAPSLNELVQACVQERTQEAHLLRIALLVAQARISPQGLPWAALIERILQDAPSPGRTQLTARGDWLELVRLLVLLHAAAKRLGLSSELSAARQRIIEELSAAFLDYAHTLNGLLFSADAPPLARIAHDFNRLDILQLGLETLGADAELRQAQQTMRLFANQVISRANALLSEFRAAHDPLLGFDVANLLVDMEELTVLAERLCEEGAVVSAGRPGGMALRQFIENTQALSQWLAQQLTQQVRQEQQRSGGQVLTGLGSGQALFIGRLRQLGLLYRFAAYWEPRPTPAVHTWADAIYRALEHITQLLLTVLENAERHRLDSSALWARLTVLADLAEQFAWNDLRQRILLAASHTAERRATDRPSI